MRVPSARLVLASLSMAEPSELRDAHIRLLAQSVPADTKLITEIADVYFEIFALFGPRHPAHFSSPHPTQDPLLHMREENARVDEYETRKNELQLALLRIQESDSVMSLLPEAAHEHIRRLRKLLSQLPLDAT